MDKKITNDATASVMGTIYQVCVALEQAFKLKEGQKLWIEKFGDVTVSDEMQIETKQYSDSLTDSHANFWNTLKNWLLPSFEHGKYGYLVLFTTQSIGLNSRFLEWNDATPNKRLEILKAILNDSENRYKEGDKSKDMKARGKPSQSLINQRVVLEDIQSIKLAEIVPKIYIASNSPKLAELRKRIIDRDAKTILQAKCDDFIDDLMGYLISPSKIQNGWEISFEDFCKKLTEVSNRYRRGTVIFPMKNIAPTDVNLSDYEEKKFVKKLKEIQYQDVIADAILHYISANVTVFEELQNYEVDPTSYRTYARNLSSSHQTRHRSAKRQVSGNSVVASQNFYDQLTGETPQPFPYFEQTPFEFRNGVFHILADAEPDDFQWKLW
jgi:hypothetical protein